MKDQYKTKQALIQELVPLRKRIAEVEKSELERQRAEETLRFSEEHFAKAFRTSPNGLVISRMSNGAILECNEGFFKIFGYIRQEVIGSSFLTLNMFADPQDRQRAVQILQELGAVRDLELDIRCKSGEVRQAVISLEKIEVAGESCMLTIINDITDRKQAEEALRRAEENFHRSLDESPLGVRIVTIDGETLYANRAILDIYGYDSVDELRASPVKKRYTPQSYAEFKIRFDKRLRGEYVPAEYEISIVRKDGVIRCLQVFRRAVLWDGKKQFQIIYNDITDSRRLEDALRKREEELAAESRQLAETNTALQVILQHREADIREMEKRIVANVEKLVLPYLGELRKRHSTPAQLNYMDILESNLQQIINPFLQNLTARFAKFTPREIQIANLIKNGKSSKEIADILMLSVRSVEFHRKNIRKKLGFTHKANNLCSFLLTLSG